MHVEGDNAEASVTNNLKVLSKIKLATNYRMACANQSKYLPTLNNSKINSTLSWDTTATDIKFYSYTEARGKCHSK